MRDTLESPIYVWNAQPPNHISSFIRKETFLSPHTDLSKIISLWLYNRLFLRRAHNTDPIYKYFSTMNPSLVTYPPYTLIIHREPYTSRPTASHEHLNKTERDFSITNNELLWLAHVLTIANSIVNACICKLILQYETRHNRKTPAVNTIQPKVCVEVMSRKVTTKETGLGREAEAVTAAIGIYP